VDFDTIYAIWKFSTLTLNHRPFTQRTNYGNSRASKSRIQFFKLWHLGGWDAVAIHQFNLSLFNNAKTFLRKGDSLAGRLKYFKVDAQQKFKRPNFLVLKLYLAFAINLNFIMVKWM